MDISLLQQIFFVLLSMGFFGNDYISYQASSTASGVLPTILDGSSETPRYEHA
jgi:hypothetical protein